MPPYLTCISLTSNTDNDHRFIDLIPGKSHLVGRASRNKHGMRAAPSNAFYDCAVVSREHAEIRSAPFSPTKSVTIIDKDSRHGTAVNGRKLVPNTPYTLKTGDVIKFGERISRGEEAHDGIVVTFHHRHALDSFPAVASPTLLNTRGFHVPDDSEQSDFGSDDESVVSINAYDRSSAKTTPEQSMMGSQKAPIDLETVAASHEAVISLIDDEGDTVLSPGAATATTVVPESISVVEESIDVAAPMQSSTTHKPASFFGVRESDFDDDDVDDDDDISQVMSDLISDGGEELELNGNVAQYVGYLHEEDDDNDSLDNSLDPSDDGSDGYVSEDEEPTSFERHRSEELGEPSMLAPKDAWVDDFDEDMAITDLVMTNSKPRYDPVRSSQQLPEGDGVTAIAQDPLAPYTSDNTGWDLQPASVSYHNDHNTSHAPGTPAAASSSFTEAPASDSTAKWPAMQSTPQMSTNLSNPSQTLQPFAQSSTAATGHTVSASSKGKLAIGNLCTPQEVVSQAAESTVLQHALPSPQPSLIAAEHVLGQSTTNKRKADLLEDSQVVERATNKVCVILDAASGNQRRIAVPTSQRARKHGLARRIAGAAATHAASATIGAAALAAFLNSPYAQRVTEYLT